MTRPSRFNMIVTVFLASMWLPAVPAAAQSQEAPQIRRFLNGIEAYERGDYHSAAEAFNELAEGGVRNGRLYYDLGNAHLKAGDLGRAILWYERASTLIPDDAALAFNLEYARGLTVDEREEANDIWGSVFFWRRHLGTDAFRWFALALNAAAVALLLLRLYRRSVLRSTTYVVTAAAAIAVSAVALEPFLAGASGRAIILPEEVSVRSAPGDTGTELFRLHAGADVRIDQELGDFIRIAFASDRMGWIPADAAGRIRWQP